jgi:hypothetical protein
MVVVLTAAAGLTAVTGAAAKGTLDQSTMPPGGYLSVVGASPVGNTAQAQTFTAGVSGFFDTVAVAVSPQASSDGRYRLSVVGTTAQGTPNGTVLARSIIDACRLTGALNATEVAFSLAAQLTAGTRYALVLDPDPANLPGASGLWSQGQGSITGGETFTKLLDAASPSWQPSQAGPEAFSTYMSAGAPPATTRGSTSLTLSAQPNPVKRYRTVSLTAHVTDDAHPTSAPAGTLRFVIDGQPSLPVPVSADGNATTTASWQTAGDHQIAASFCPTDASLISSDATATITVSAAKTATTTTLTIDPAASVAWQDDTLTATVTSTEPGGPLPSGNVQFAEEDGTPIGDPAPVGADGRAVIHATAGAGTYTLRALFQGDDLYEPSEDTADVTVSKASSVTTLQSSDNPAVVGTTITWLIDVSAVPPSESIPTGTVDVAVDGIPQGTFDLDDIGQIALAASNFQVGSHTVTMHYSGDIDYLPSDGTFIQNVIAEPGPAPASAPGTAASSSAAKPATSTPVVKPLTAARLLGALHMPATLSARAGKVTVGTAANPPLRSVTVDLVAAGGIRAAATSATSLGHATVTVAAGKRRTIKVTLNRAGRRALRSQRSVRVQVRLKAVDSAGRTVKTTAKRTLKAARR